MKKYKFLLLDLDGTLIDSRQDIADATNATLALWGVAPMSTPVICSFVGSGVKELLKAATESVDCNVNDDQIKEGIAFFKSNYEKNCLVHTVWYPGVVSTLKKIVNHIPLALITNKPLGLTHSILKGLEGKHFFSQILTEGEGFPKKPDPQGALHLIARAHVKADEVLLVGDSKIDWETAQNAGIDLALVTYGLTPEKEIRALPARYTLNEFEELLDIVGPISPIKS